MSVYVDQPLIRDAGILRPKITCHLYGDTLEELHAMALSIGIEQSCFQHDPRLPHYKIVTHRRAHAVRLGAKEHTPREMAAFLRSHNRAVTAEPPNVEEPAGELEGLSAVEATTNS